MRREGSRQVHLFYSLVIASAVKDEPLAGMPDFKDESTMIRLIHLSIGHHAIEPYFSIRNVVARMAISFSLVSMVTSVPVITRSGISIFASPTHVNKPELRS